MPFSAPDRPNRVGVTAPSSDSSTWLATTAFIKQPQVVSAGNLIPNPPIAVGASTPTYNVQPGDYLRQFDDFSSTGPYTISWLSSLIAAGHITMLSHASSTSSGTILINGGTGFVVRAGVVSSNFTMVFDTNYFAYYDGTNLFMI